MIIYPAIDLRKGKCVRLYQGDYQRETIYSADPFTIAKAFIAEGAGWFHIVVLVEEKNPNHNKGSLFSKLIKPNHFNLQ